MSFVSGEKPRQGKQLVSVVNQMRVVEVVTLDEVVEELVAAKGAEVVVEVEVVVVDEEVVGRWLSKSQVC